MPDEFVPDLFVGRTEELDGLIDWATAPTVPRGVLTIAAPPGYGKTWLLHQLEHRLRKRRDIFFILAPSADLKTELNIVNWLSFIVDEAQRICPKARNTNTIAHLLEDLCENCNPVVRPILIVDGFDELLPSERKMLEIHLLEKFWGRKDCARMAISLRDEFSLSSPILRRSERRLKLRVFSPETGETQLQKRAELQKEALVLPAELKPLIPPYNWTHPRINTHLYETIYLKKQNQLDPALTADELKKCWLSLMEEKLDQEGLELNTIEVNLKALAGNDQQEALTLQEFAAICNHSLSSASTHIQNLMKLSLVSSSKQKYRVVDGIREIIRAEVALRGKESPHG